MQENTLVFSIFLIFSGSALLATVALWARQSLLAAYIIIGIILGPWGLKWVTDAYVIHQVSDVGIVFLLFLLGLHLEPKRLWLMLKNVISIGVLSSFLFFSIGFLLAKLWGGYSFSECMIIGAAMMFSSTIIGLKMMPPTALHHHPVGEMMIGLLLFQDLLAILLLLILNIAGLGTFHMQDVTMISIGFPVIIILAFLLEQWFLMPLMTRFQRAREYMFLLAIAWCLSMSELSGYFGLSHEIGAFIAGVAIASENVAAYLAECLQPLRDFFLVLFFFSVGASFNLDYLSAIYIPALCLSAMLIIIKPLAFRFLCIWVGESVEMSSELGVRLGQASEFSLLISYIAMSSNLISPKASYLIQATTVITFFCSSYWVVSRYSTPLSMLEESLLGD
jgi:Kef-type K+ transport system membrane component KefB